MPVLCKCPEGAVSCTLHIHGLSLHSPHACSHLGPTLVVLHRDAIPASSWPQKGGTRAHRMEVS